MNKKPMGLNEFEKYMNSIKRVYDYENKLNDFLKQNVEDGYLYQPNCIETAIDLLSLHFGDTDDWIGYYVFDLDFGKSYEPGWVRSKVGEDIPLFTVEDLYNLLVNNMREVDGQLANME